MVKEQIVEFETAKLAKEKGFNWPVYKSYQISLTEQDHPEDGKSGPFGWEKGELSLVSGFFINNHKGIDLSGKNWYLCSAPTQSFLQRWLREEHDIVLLIGRLELQLNESQNKYYIEIWKGKDVRETFDTYEEALEKGLQEGLKLIK